MDVLVDTGVLLRAFDRSLPEQPTIFRAFRELWSQNHQLATTLQNIAEFWNVSTRPVQARGGFGLPVAIVDARVKLIERLGDVLPFPDRAYQEWRRLVAAHQIVGVAVHEAKLVATMNVAKIQHVLTMNAADFQRYPGLTIWTPDDVVQS
ncbi:MAG TPA: PIN domain-containing protein [Pirellulaceae bacterium]|nr:PIN domain-containing protein [Pirellulaceae bacterium]